MDPNVSSSRPLVKIASKCGVYRLIFVNKFPNKLQFAWSTTIAMDGDISISMTFACINNHQPCFQLVRMANHSKPRPTASSPQSKHRQDDPSSYASTRCLCPMGSRSIRSPWNRACTNRWPLLSILWDDCGSSKDTVTLKKRPEGEGLDRIVIFADKDGDGSFEDRKVFQEGLNLVSGLEVGHGGVWVGAAPELLFIPDRNHDDVPDAAPRYCSMASVMQTLMKP